MERTYWRGVAWTYQGGQKQVSNEGDGDDDDNHYIPDQMDSLSSIFDGGRQYAALLQAWKPSLGHQDSGGHLIETVVLCAVWTPGFRWSQDIGRCTGVVIKIMI